MSDSKTIKKGITSALSVKIISLVISVLVIPLYIDYFKEDYAVIIILISFTAYLTLSHIGLPYSMITIGTQYKTLEEKNSFFLKVSKIYLPYVIILIFASVLFRPFLIKIISKILELDRNEIVSSAIFWSIIYTFTNIFFLFFHSSFQAVNNLKVANIYQGFLTVVPPLSLLISFFFKLKIDFFFMMCFLLVLFIGTIMSIHYLFKYSSELIDFGGYRGSIRNIAITSITALVLNLISVSLSNIDILMLSKFNISDNNIVSYSVMQKIILLQTMIFGTICSTLLPMFGKWYGSGNFNKIIFNYNIFFKSLLTICSVLIFFNILFIEDVIGLWIGESKFIGRDVMILLSLSIYIYICYTISYSIIHSFNIKRKLTLLIALFETLFKIGISVLMIKYLGYFGAAVGVFVFALLVELPIYSWMIKNYSNNKVIFNFKFFIKHAIILLVYVCLLNFFIIHFNLSLRIIFYLIITIIYLLNVYTIINFDDRKVLKKIFKQKLSNVKW